MRPHIIHTSSFPPTPSILHPQVRGYLFIEHLHHLDHDKEAYMPSVSVINKEIKVLADNSPIEMRPWLGGVDFYFDIPATAPNSHWVDLTIPGFKHFTRFPVSMCMPSPSPSPPSSALALTSSPPSPSSSITLTSPETSYTHTRKYIMHVHLNDHKDRGDINPVVVRGVANHIAYHMCTLSLDNYEVWIGYGYAFSQNYFGCKYVCFVLIILCTRISACVCVYT
ncbi:hypothetical protein EON63_01645 [archaeon]|nr:MAG: hypothetical protein EON63_01645 [archaeon]